MAHKNSLNTMGYEQRKSALGVRMTTLYSVVYIGFVGVSVFRPQWMGVRAIFGLNLAIAYGLGLILFAIILAVIYNYLCKVPVEHSGKQQDADGQAFPSRGDNP